MHIPHLHIESFKGALHLAVVFIVMLKLHLVDKKLSLLERKFTRK